jgi:hypothetical protein
MITELDYIAYFENLATQSKDFNHGQDGKVAFFYLPDEWDLTEIENVLNTRGKTVPVLLLDSVKGQLDDNASQNYLQGINGQITILTTADTGKVITIRAARDYCLALGLKLMARMRYDTGKRMLFKPTATFRISGTSYDPVGPIELIHYGYTFRFKISCPFAFSTDSGSWRDI